MVISGDSDNILDTVSAVCEEPKFKSPALSSKKDNPTPK